MGLVLTGGKSIAEAAREVGIDDSTLGNWVKRAEIDRGEREGISTDERARLREPGAGERAAADGA